MKKFIFTSVFLSIFFVLPSWALDISHFTQTEYGFNIQEPDSMNIAPNSLSGQREKLYNFINFEPGHDEKLVTYLDTPNRDLNKNALIIRVREDVTKPSKTKITVKLRAESPEAFGDLNKYRKAEIDIVGGEKKYSVSWDIKYHPNDYDVRRVDVPAILERIKKKNPEAWSAIESRLDGKTDQIQQTMVMRALYWEGPITKVPGIVEADYSIWSPYYRKPAVAFTSISFKGKTKDKNLAVIAQRIEAVLTEKGLAVPAEKSYSKTRKTFDMSSGFK